MGMAEPRKENTPNYAVIWQLLPEEPRQLSSWHCFNGARGKVTELKDAAKTLNLKFAEDPSVVERMDDM